jgi:lauroyl/myristoyl acyltransferase
MTIASAPDVATRPAPTQVDELDDDELREWLAGSSCEELQSACWKRFFPIWINFVSLLRTTTSPDEIARIASDCTKVAIWENRTYSRRLKQIPDMSLRDIRGSGIARFNAQTLAPLLARGRGLIVSSFRFGSYTLLPLELALSGLDVLLVVKQQLSPAFGESFEAAKAALRRNMRERGEDGDVPANWPTLDVFSAENPKAPLKMASALRRNGVVVAYADGNTGSDGLYGEESRTTIQFWGLSITVKTGVARLAMATGAPILPVLAQTTPFGRLRAITGDVIWPPEHPLTGSDREQFVQVTLQRLYDFLREHAGRCPEHWPGVSAVHRWRRPDASGMPAATTSAEEIDRRIDSHLRAGGGVMLDKARGVVCLSTPRGQTVIVDTRTLITIVVPEALGAFARIMDSAQGVTLSELDGHEQQPAAWSLVRHLALRNCLALRA